MDEISTGRWFVAATQVGRETIAETNLQRQGFNVWFLRQKKTVKHARRRVEKLVSFFPGYIFVHLDLEKDRWRSVNGTLGVRALIMQGGMPTACPVGLVEKFQELAEADGTLNIDSYLVAGADVRITSGPFADIIGTLVSMERTDRARVLLKLLNGEVVATIGKSALAPAKM